MTVNAFSGVGIERPLAEPGVYQQPQHIASNGIPKTTASKPVEQADTVEISAKKEAKKDNGFINGISKIAKFFVSLDEMTKASIKAVLGGAATAAGTLAAFWIAGTLPRAVSQNRWKDAFKAPLKNTSKTGKITAGVLAAAVATYHIIRGILKMNQRTANVDHSLKTGHRTV